jgi:hypothetical protein
VKNKHDSINRHLLYKFLTEAQLIRRQMTCSSQVKDNSYHLVMFRNRSHLATAATERTPMSRGFVTAGEAGDRTVQDERYVEVLPRATRVTQN